jgi:hypothetical protein
MKSLEEIVFRSRYRSRRCGENRALSLVFAAIQEVISLKRYPMSMRKIVETSRLIVGMGRNLIFVERGATPFRYAAEKISGQRFYSTPILCDGRFDLQAHVRHLCHEFRIGLGDAAESDRISQLLAKLPCNYTDTVIRMVAEYKTKRRKGRRIDDGVIRAVLTAEPTESPCLAEISYELSQRFELAMPVIVDDSLLSGRNFYLTRLVLGYFGVRQFTFFPIYIFPEARVEVRRHPEIAYSDNNYMPFEDEVFIQDNNVQASEGVMIREQFTDGLNVMTSHWLDNPAEKPVIGTGSMVLDRISTEELQPKRCFPYYTRYYELLRRATPSELPEHAKRDELESRTLSRWAAKHRSFISEIDRELAK